MTDNELTKETDELNAAERDGGTGKREFADFKSAARSVSNADKRRAFIMLGAAGVTFAVLLLSRLFWLMEPVFDMVYYATVSELLYYGIVAVIFTGFSIGLDRFLRKKCNVKLFARRRSGIHVNRALGVIAIGAGSVFVISACLGMTLKMQHEMGLGVTLSEALINVSVYLDYGLHLWMGFIMAALVQYAMSILVPTKYTVPWGAIVLVTVFGLTEFMLEALTTAHKYTWIYYLLNYAYASIFMLTHRKMHISYWASFIILVL